MHCLSFSAALALVVGSTQTMACQNMDCAVGTEVVILVVEVAATTLVRDLNRKRRVYARAGVPEYWVVDVAARVIHQLWSPAADTYAARREIPFGTQIEAATVPGLTVATASL